MGHGVVLSYFLLQIYTSFDLCTNIYVSMYAIVALMQNLHEIPHDI